ncbi:MAG: pilin [bacterium]|nr:pilin [bacterium]
MFKNNQKKLISIIILSGLIFILLPQISLADNTPSLPNPISGDEGDKINVEQVMIRIMQLTLAIVDVFALLMFILGGFEFLTSAGNPEKVKKAKDTLIWATIGIVVITLSYTLLKFVFEQATKTFVT